MKDIIAIFFFFIALSAFGQSDIDRQLSLEKIKLESAANYEIQSQRVFEYAQKNNIPIFYTDAFRTSRMVGVDDFGIPIYVSTDNANAAITTNVIALRKNNPLGLNLEGNGMRAAIWDAGSIAHIEFGNRIIATEGTASDHSNHVAGTILAQGINPSAKGMAPKATLVSFDFNNDISEMATMAKPDQTSLLLSNHSYGFVTGWDCTNGCQWRGNTGISSVEDYRFGFYTGNTRSWDLIANNAPYYTIVKSAGNDRQSGAGTGPPPDCNGGSGYDCLEEQATAKNILTIGAVQQVLTYSNPNDVIMSTFSGWGPTDDGRIKPDLVGDGVNVFSTITNNGYMQFSGTSMSSPNVMGSLVLIQELYRNLNGGNFMLSSTLKALAIHTAKEAGLNPGPDYQFGWGLLDVGSAANVLTNIDNQNVYVLERDLKSLEVFELPILPKANQKITATLAWNDPAGTSPPISLDPANLMLVNDLDMRIVDDQGNAQFPWALDPSVGALGSAAFKADNLRDNVEKIEFDNPQLIPYKIRISAKNALANPQKYSLIVTYTSIQDPPQKLYWVGESGDWNDAGHWSATSGGSPSSTVPDASTKVIFDENSFSAAGTVTFSNPASCQSLLFLASSEKINFNLNANPLALSGDFISTDSIFSVSSAGDFQFSGTASININNSNFSQLNFSFDGTSFKLLGKGKLGQVTLKKGTLDMSNASFQIGSLNATTSGVKTLNIKNATISGLGLSNLNAADNLTLQSDSVIVQTRTAPAQFNWSGINLTGTLKTNTGMLTINGSNQILRAAVDGSLSLNGNNQFTNFSMTPGSTLILSNNSIQTLTNKTVIQSNSTLKTNLQSPGHAQMNFEGLYKLCFDFLNITGVEVTGLGSINAGLNSTLVNAQNWFQENCQDVIVPDFVVTFPCSGGQTKFTDASQGLITNYHWSFPGTVVTSGINTNIATAIFPAPAIYQVQLTVSNSKFSKSLQKDVIIGTNDLNNNLIILNNLNLFSQEFAPSYQWFKNDIAIPGATQRSYPYNGQAGSYTILTSNANCNRISPIFIITELQDSESTRDEMLIFPNPASNLVNLSTPSADEMNIILFDIMGRSVGSYHLGLNEKSINTSDIPTGIYVMLIEQKNRKFYRKLMIVK